jgi:hypothetical protein
VILLIRKLKTLNAVLGEKFQDCPSRNRSLFHPLSTFDLKRIV